MLRDYFTEQHIIDGLETYIVSPEMATALLEDRDTLAAAGVSRFLMEREVQTIRRTKCFALYLAFAHLPCREKCRWFPLICWKYRGRYYHVSCRSTWLCRNCGALLKADILMPLWEAEPGFYRGQPAVPYMFQKVPCICCGKYLQNHLFLGEWQMTSRKL